MTLELFYGDGVSGRYYYMQLDGKHYSLLGSVMGTPDDAKEARAKANEIIKAEVKDLATCIGLQQVALLVRFKWDGSI